MDFLVKFPFFILHFSFFNKIYWFFSKCSNEYEKGFALD